MHTHTRNHATQRTAHVQDSLRGDAAAIVPLLLLPLLLLLLLPAALLRVAAAAGRLGHGYVRGMRTPSLNCSRVARRGFRQPPAIRSTRQDRAKAGSRKIACVIHNDGNEWSCVYLCIMDLPCGTQSH